MERDKNNINFNLTPDNEEKFNLIYCENSKDKIDEDMKFYNTQIFTRKKHNRKKDIERHMRNKGLIIRKNKIKKL